MAADQQPPNPLFYTPDGYFKSPELAAFHATEVQGGFSTPAREARRMVKDGGPGAQMAILWLASHGLTVEGDAEPSGSLITAPAPVPQTSPLADPPAATIDLDADPVTVAWYRAIEGWDERIAQLREKRERAVELIQAAMGNATEARNGGRPVVSWKPSAPSMRLDRKALEKAYGVEAIEAFLRPSKPARPFKLLAQDGA